MAHDIGLRSINYGLLGEVEALAFQVNSFEHGSYPFRVVSGWFGSLTSEYSQTRMILQVGSMSSDLQLEVKV